MIVFRISRERYARDLSGTGARIYGGRWNAKGTSLLYTAESRALAAMELAVHTDMNDLFDDLQLVTLSVPGQDLLALDPLPSHWNQHPPHPASQRVGEQFVTEGKALILKVPSVVIRGDYNYLINPGHTGFQQIEIVSIEPFQFDQRLIK